MHRPRAPPNPFAVPPVPQPHPYATFESPHHHLSPHWNASSPSAHTLYQPPPPTRPYFAPIAPVTRYLFPGYNNHFAGPSSDNLSPRLSHTPPKQSPTPAAIPAKSSSTGPTATRKKPASKKPRTSAAPVNRDPDDFLAPDYSANPAGPASSAYTSFKCPKCDKTYKGKHARSIWRRHLQDKHGIPLSSQPRRTRWDNDAQRPKDEEERHERTLESKRRWAKKNRDERKSSEEILEDDLFENESENVDPSDDGNWIDEDVAPKVTRKSQEVHARNAVTKRPSLAESIADDTTEGDLSFESLEGGRDEWRGRGGSAPLRSREAMLKEDEGISRPMLRASMSMGGYVDGNRARSPAGPYPAYQVPSSGHQQYPQYLQRPPNPPPQTYLSHSMYQSQSAQAYYHPQPSRHQQVPEHYTHPPPYYPSQHFVEEVSSPQIFYGITPSNSESALTNNDNRNHHIPQSSSLPNLSNARRAPRTVPPPTTTNTSSTIYYQEPQRHQPVLSQASDSSYEYDTADLISKGLLAQPYRGGATSERDRLMSVQEATRAPVGGGGKEDAACVLMALKKGCSSPSSPRVSHPSLHPRTYYQQPPIPQLQYSIPKSRSPGLDRIKTSSIYGVGVGESSLDEDDGSFSFATSSRRLLVEPDSPPSSTTSDSELRTTNTLASRLPKRAASESPPLSNPRESPKKSRPSNRAVPPTTPGVFNAVLDSSPAVEFDGELVGQDENFEEGATTVEALDYTRGRGGRVRDDSGSPSADVKKGKGRSSIVERGSSPTTTWQARPQATARATKPTSSTRGRAGEMLPPHPGSSSSASSFNLSTPAGPSSHDALSFKSFYASNAAVNSSGGGVMYGAGNLQRDDQYYHSLHLSSAPLPSHRRHHYGQPGSSPPSNGFLFSSPANPGISKQLGLTAQPGPGVYVAIAGETPGKVHGNVQLGRDSAEGGGKRGKVGKEASLMAELLGKEQRLKEIPESEGV